METITVTSNLEITLQSYAGGPQYRGTPQPLGTPWLTEVTLNDGETEVNVYDIPVLKALLTASPPPALPPGTAITFSGTTYNF